MNCLEAQKPFPLKFFCRGSTNIPRFFLGFFPNWWPLIPFGTFRTQNITFRRKSRLLRPKKQAFKDTLWKFRNSDLPLSHECWESSTISVRGALWQRPAVCPPVLGKKWQFYGRQKDPHAPMDPSSPPITTPPMLPHLLFFSPRFQSQRLNNIKRILRLARCSLQLALINTSCSELLVFYWRSAWSTDIFGWQDQFSIPDNCRRRGRCRQCKFFWPV